jgi:hypothetical protein
MIGLSIDGRLFYAATFLAGAAGGVVLALIWRI